MKTEPLIKTNPYLQDPLERQRLIARSVKTQEDYIAKQWREEGIQQGIQQGMTVAKPSYGKKKVCKKAYNKAKD